ncbi:tyrosine--tRNA ligase [bacterium]|nr:MAG: tyrosine--tRNA ligase [bacterium]|tara:strand:- start:17246 stop:18439 length:1194 start_codon:yes stop_codon:yes gene_type:complete
MNFLSPSEQLQIIKENVEEIIPEEELLNKLKNSYKESKPLKIKAGFDPTSADLHLGHTLLIKKLKIFQDLGHEINFLIGDFTARIGDPTGRDKTRPPLSEEKIISNSKTYENQLFKILDKNNVNILYNSKWFDKFDLKKLIGLSSMENVARILERDDFKNRYTSGEAITLTEFLYPLLQAYDSVHLESDVELGGTDQRFNILLGRQIQKAYGKDLQVAIFLPILEGIDGNLKMSKSYKNYIGINEEPNDIFGKIMSISDELMEKYIKILFSNNSELFAKILSPLDRKKKLAISLITDYHNEQAALKAKNDFEKTYSNKDFPDDIKKQVVDLNSKNIIELIEEFTSKSFTRSEIKRLIKSSSIQMNDLKIHNLDFVPKKDLIYEIKIGKRKFYKVTFK